MYLIFLRKNPIIFIHFGYYVLIYFKFIDDLGDLLSSTIGHFSYIKISDKQKIPPKKEIFEINPLIKLRARRKDRLLRGNIFLTNQNQ